MKTSSLASRFLSFAGVREAVSWVVVVVVSNPPPGARIYPRGRVGIVKSSENGAPCQFPATKIP
jgi:hypothetical protein